MKTEREFLKERVTPNDNLTDKRMKTDNETIAEFDGLFTEVVDGKKLWTFKDKEGESYSYASHELEYHSSWDWLMPVVEKIKLLTSTQNEYYGRIINALFTVDINNVYKAVVEFIKWYNQQKQ